jgi:hypothetical protein
MNKDKTYNFIDTNKKLEALPDLRMALTSAPQLRRERITAADTRTYSDLNIVHDAVHSFLGNILSHTNFLEIKPNKKVTVFAENTLTTGVDIFFGRDPSLDDNANKELFDKDPIVIAAKTILAVFKDSNLHSYLNFVSFNGVETGSLQITYNGYCIKIIIDRQQICMITIIASNT